MSRWNRTGSATPRSSIASGSRAVLENYRAVYRHPGTARLSAAAFVMRAPIAMYPLGLVLIMSARDGRYGFAGVLSGCYIAGGTVGNQLASRLIDRYGQRRVINPAAIAHTAAVVALVLLLEARAPHLALVAPAVALGLTYLPIGALIRARWSSVLAGRPELSTAYSVESTLDEVVFVIGPLTATLIATHLDPVIVLYVAVVLIVAGGGWLASMRGSEPAPHPSGPGSATAVLRAPGMLLLVLAAAGMGAMFASAEVTMVAFCGQHHHRSLSGLALAGFAFGSGIAGFVYGSRHRSDSLARRFRRQALVFALLPLLFLLAGNVAALIGAAVVVGLGVAPTLITAFGLAEQVSPPGMLTEALTWLGSGLNVGYGVGAAVVGGIADAHGARVAFTVTVVASMAVGALAVATARAVAPSKGAALP